MCDCPSLRYCFETRSVGPGGTLRLRHSLVTYPGRGLSMRLSNAGLVVLTMRLCPHVVGVAVLVAGPRVVLGHVGSPAELVQTLARDIAMRQQLLEGSLLGVAFVVPEARLTFLPSKFWYCSSRSRGVLLCRVGRLKTLHGKKATLKSGKSLSIPKFMVGPSRRTGSSRWKLKCL